MKMPVGVEVTSTGMFSYVPIIGGSPLNTYLGLPLAVTASPLKTAYWWAAHYPRGQDAAATRKFEFYHIEKSMKNKLFYYFS